MKKIIVAILVTVTLFLPNQVLGHSHTTADKVIESGKKYIGTPYQFGAPVGNTASFDCSSFSATIFAEHGIQLPRVSEDQAKMGIAVTQQQLQKGDLLFYDTNFDGRINHLSVYISSTEMIHASSSVGVHITSPNTNYWNTRFVTVRRVILEETNQNNQYIVKQGDTLFLIARAHQVTVQQLRDWNQLQSDVIFIGQRLIVQGQTTSINQVQVPSANGFHTVASGESLWTISRSYQVSINELIEWNGLSSNTIFVGQRLVVQNPAAVKTYIVKAGDSLWKIATEHNTTVARLTELNNLTTSTILVGQTLRLP